MNLINSGVSGAASDKGDVLHPRELDIGDEIAVAVEMTIVFFACEPNADSLVRHQRITSIVVASTSGLPVM